MDNVRISRDADALISVLYKVYLDRRKSGTPKEQALFFSDSHYIHENLMPKWGFEDVDSTCWELHEAGLLSCLPGDGIAYLVMLTDQAVIYQENRFQDKAEGFLGYLERLRALLPW